MSAAWTFTLTCRYCGALCTPRSTVPSTGVETRLVADCTECDGEMLVVVVLRPAHTDRLDRRPVRKAECGTNSGYVAHVANREETCAACKAAHTAYQRGLRARKNTRQGTAA